jgi:hypothetical protein
MAVANEAMSSNFSRVNQAQFMQYNVEEENADRAVNWSARTFMALEKAFDRHQNGGEQKLTVRHMPVAKNGHELAKSSKWTKRGRKNATPLMNGTANDMKRHEVLLGENEDGQ